MNELALTVASANEEKADLGLVKNDSSARGKVHCHNGG